MKNYFYTVILLFSIALMSGCETPTNDETLTNDETPTNDETSTSSSDNNSYVISKFSANYFDNGVLIASELVNSPSIRYSRSNFRNIPASSFSASWVSEITVTGDLNHIIDINFDASWSEVSLIINSVEIDNWVNSNNSIKHKFQPGTHSVEINYTNTT